MKIIHWLTAFVFAIPNLVHGQGCSDAGFCSVGSLGLHVKSQETNRQTLKLALPVGIGDENVFVFTPALEYTLQLKDRWQLQGKIAGNYASGNLGSVAGAGDVYIAGTYVTKPAGKWTTSFTLGTKLPLNQSDLSKDGLSLPMQYQSSLGTVDIIAGVSVASARWQFAAGWQQPLTGINLNHFLPVYYDSKEAIAYPPSNDFNRKGDVLLRADYMLVRRRKLQLNGGLLGIYHLGKDTYIDGNVQNGPIDLQGSSGLTLNVTGLLNYAISNRFDLSIIGGVPLVVRDIRPDGLTRSIVVAPQISYHF